MSKEEWNLSDKIIYPNKGQVYITHLACKDVKEFIRRLKKEILGKQGLQEQDFWEICQELDKLAGEKLSK